MPPFQSACLGAPTYGFLCFGSNRTMCLLAVGFHGGWGFSSQPFLAQLQPQGRGTLQFPSQGQVWGAPGELCWVSSTASAPGEPWWGQTSLQLRPVIAHQLTQLVWVGKSRESWAQELTAGLSLPWWVHQLTAGASGEAQQPGRSGRLRKRPCT